MCGRCLIHQEHFQGLVTLLTFVAIRSLKPCFMPEMPIGLTLQSFLPGQKAATLLGLSMLPCRSSLDPKSSSSLKPGSLIKSSSFEAFFLRPDSARLRPVQSQSRPCALIGFSHLRLPLKISNQLPDCSPCAVVSALYPKVSHSEPAVGYR